MTSSVRILSTTSVDSSPAILLVAPNGNKTLVNCAEGCQRSFLEFGQKLSTVNRVCLTHLTHSSLGGLPGMILTAADVQIATAVANAQEKSQGEKSPTKDLKGFKNAKRLLVADELPGLELIGPKGIQQFTHSLRHFMRREAFQVRIYEGDYSHSNPPPPPSKKSKRKKGASGNTPGEEDFRLQTIQCSNSDGLPFLSFIFTTPPIQGRFLAEKAKNMGIPPGPIYGQLKAGKSVTFVHPKTGVEHHVQGSDLVEPGSPGVAVAIFYYPDLDVLKQIQTSPHLQQFGTAETQLKSETPQLEVILHITSSNIFHTNEAIEWRTNFGDNTNHVFIDTNLPTSRAQDPGTVFHSARAGALCRAKIAPGMYLSPDAGRDSSGSLIPTISGDDSQKENHVPGIPFLEYNLIPRAKRGFTNFDKFQSNCRSVEDKMLKVLAESGAIASATSIIGQDMTNVSTSLEGEIIFTGTGSAIPCKHRNVSGIYLEMANRNAILLDLGEGTIGQLLRAKESEDHGEIFRRICAVWISHPHADHHLGILRLLSERRSVSHGKNGPVIVIAPPNILGFLKEYERIDPTIEGTYTFVDCYDISTKARPQEWAPSKKAHIQACFDRLKEHLGIVEVKAVPVAHCPHSYAVELKGTPFGSVAYSGDCRPSMLFAKVAENADLLIHEATFIDGLEADAALKRHCTVGEALGVGREMKAKCVVLTHFSQRYPKIPPVPLSAGDDDGLPIIFAFDYMKLTPQTLKLASRVTPAIRLLYPEETIDNINDDLTEVRGSDALEVPGLFAQTELL